MIYYYIVLLSILGAFTCLAWREMSDQSNKENYNTKIIKSDKKENIQECKDSKTVAKQKIKII